ncbi:MAG: threonylcarbamoyl-AMP synthase [Hyphomicrobiaceae bacterium]|nr:threonylcarbamoyl-AMP synthase [Hyphomicrobiaceae bacterium]MCC0023098.1 threonylcarbamoyl-AMP synthase [Hyphomicrobiaceae bacterium]
MPHNPVTFDEAVALLRNGEVCAFATETVYGLGADATNSDAVLKIYQTKNRPRFNPLIAHCADLQMAQGIAEFDELALRLAALWPGALTLVLPLKSGVEISDLVTAGLDTIAVRVPGHFLARRLIAAAGKPLAAPSANPSGRLSPTSVEMVRTAFDDQVPVLDGGDCEKGVESTILSVIGGKVVQLRAGALAREDIERAAGIEIELAKSDMPVAAPGMLKSHYAPRAGLRLNAMTPNPGETYLGFGAHSGPEGALNLSPKGDLNEAARNLFAYLARLDATGTNAIAIAPIPDDGLGEAINDRLERAAAPQGEY